MLISETTAAACSGVLVKHVLHHRRGLRQDADAGGDVDEEDAPQQIELHGADRLVSRDAAVGDHRGASLAGGVQPAGFQPAGGRSKQARADQHDDQIGRAERHHGVGDADAIHEEDVEVAGEEGAAAESHDGHAGRHAAAIGKPFHQRADRARCSRARSRCRRSRPCRGTRGPAVADARPMPPMSQAGAEEQRGGGRGGARAAPLDPRSAERGAQSEQHQRRRERRVGRTEPPGIGRKQRLDRPVEGAPRVHRADADVHRDGADRNRQRLKDVAEEFSISSSRTVIDAAKYIPHGNIPTYFFENRRHCACLCNHASDSCRRGHDPP